MTKKEFLQELQRGLTGKLNSGQIAEHMEYYSEYIEIAVRKGEAEERVLECLGSPRLIAKNLTDTAGPVPKKEVVWSLTGAWQRVWKQVKDWFAKL